MAPATFSTQHRGTLVEVVPDKLWERDRITLRVDGEEVAHTKANGPKTVLKAEGFEIRAVTPLWGGSIVRAELVPADGEPVALEPAAGTRAARRAAFERAHPTLYAGRHVIKGAAQVAFALLGLSFLVRLLMQIPLPAIDVDVPRLDLPDIPWPQLDLPNIALPGWLQAILAAKPYWLPIVIGLVAASAEIRRRRKVGSRDDRARHAARPRAGASERH